MARGGSPFRLVFPALLLAALLARLFVPPGYMLARGEGGAPRLVLCPGSAPAPRPEQAATGHHGHGQDKAPDREAPRQAPCAFAILLDSPLAPLAPILAPPPLPSSFRPAAPRLSGAFHPPLAAPPPPATGPPPNLSA